MKKLNYKGHQVDRRMSKDRLVEIILELAGTVKRLQGDLRDQKSGRLRDYGLHYEEIPSSRLYRPLAIFGGRPKR